ncbi:hypothetical protein Snoj_18110 [Streptomyces nojiriensis]|uniref:Sensor protein KdpD transmembrane domain-containing protein n=1 Tax=Streptomyces nojiriensis TaxID=66374 RepID=A0ABQ3SIC4_9ACTN|nr:DUF4118 domain-containing protein [Streptomyces nojiriensis]QTI49507.1 hypothetical protein JYK04_07379 [Streptomyces nojiriensis]GGS25086.1 hypothetical protein GCM10010205_63940 [Streptomyces nojiriensis]GHI67893.1 hypothetical protein Snoj_18110 [Streptomyces nojiriensis]
MSGYWSRLHDPLALVAALVAPFLVALALVPFRTDLSATNEALIMVVVVVAVASLGTRAAGALAALSAAAWFDFFLTRPYQQFTIADGDEIQTAVLLLAVGLIVSQLAARTRRLQAVAVTDAAHLSSLQGTARLAEDGASPEAVVEYARRELVGLLELRGCRFEYGTLMGHLPRLEHDGSLWLRRGSRITEYTEWPEGETELRAVGGGHYYGRFLLDPYPGRPLPPEEARLVAVTLAAQAGVALDSAGLPRQV